MPRSASRPAFACAGNRRSKRPLLLPRSQNPRKGPRTARCVRGLDPLSNRALIESSQIERHGEFLYLPHLRAAEQSIAASVKTLASSPAAYPPIDEDAALAWVMKKTGKELAESQQRAVREALRQRLLIITGGPGVGKTTILRSILLILQSKQVKLVLAAPTGRAAKRLSESTGLEAKTLHRLLEYQGDGDWGRHRGKPLVGDLFVVDEASMIDAPLMAQFLSALPPGAHLLIVGDADQLPSVGPGMVLHDLIASGAVPCVKLTEIFRQAASSRIITSAHAINRGQVPDLKPASRSDFFFLEASEPEEIRDLIVQLAHTRLPAKYGFDPIADIQVLTPMNRNLLGTASLNHSLQLALNPPNEVKFEIERFQTTFRVGDKVIQTHNNYDKEVFNGDIGHITAIDADPVKAPRPLRCPAPRRIRTRRARRAPARLRPHHSQKPGQRVPLRHHSRQHAALRPARAQPDLHRHHPRQKALHPRRR
jgi:exodeoxyribonuclease V alpha subunit